MQCETETITVTLDPTRFMLVPVEIRRNIFIISFQLLGRHVTKLGNLGGELIRSLILYLSI